MSRISRVRLALAWATLLFSTGQSAFATTLTVEKDGSGDYTKIQDAVDAAAPGDTVLVGLGEWVDYSLYTFEDGDPAQGIVAIDKGPLTLRGVDRDGVLIGPLFPRLQVDGLPTFSIGVDKGNALVVLENFTVRNTKFTLLAVSTIHLRDCTLIGGDGPVIGLNDGAIIERCRFESSGGLSFLPGTSDNRNITVYDCEFRGNGYGLNAGGTVDLLIDRCIFRDNTVGVGFWSGAQATVTFCRFERSANVHVGLSGGSPQVKLDDNVLDSGASASVLTSGKVFGERNRIGGGRSVTIDASGRGAYVRLIDGDILNGGGHSVRLAFTQDTGLGNFDMTRNYWGTEDTAQIDEWIFDGNDYEPELLVEYEPIRLTPLTVKPSTFGSLKSRFRR